MQELLLFGVLIGAIALIVASFFTTKWFSLALAFILSLIGGYSSFVVQNTFCAEVVGALDCITTTTYNFELVLVFGSLALLSMVMMFLRGFFASVGVQTEEL